MILIDRRQIATMIPHAGTMCLLDAVLRWDSVSLQCMSRCHRRQDNPMRRRQGTLGAACGIEMAAQAMALHGRLTEGGCGPPPHGYLASLRDLHLRTPCLDEVSDDLIINVERVMGDATGATYRFKIAGSGAELLSGRATVLLRAPA